MRTHGYQTIELREESISERQKIGPILSTSYDENNNLKDNKPFAGDGYYFWENNIEAARWWGNTHIYSRKKMGYRIFKYEFEILYDGTFFDLVGNMEHIIYLGKLIDKIKINFSRRGKDIRDWELNQYITHLRNIAKTNPSIFPYTAIRFNDYKRVKGERINLDKRVSPSFILRNPYYIVCFFDINKLNLQKYTFFQQRKQVEAN